MLHFKLVCTTKKNIESDEISEVDLLSLIKLLYTHKRNVGLGKILIKLYEKFPNAYDELKKVLP